MRLRTSQGPAQNGTGRVSVGVGQSISGYQDPDVCCALGGFLLTPVLTGRNRGGYPMDTGDHEVATGDQGDSMRRGVGSASVSSNSQ